jgi:hypothetical protein
MTIKNILLREDILIGHGDGKVLRLGEQTHEKKCLPTFSNGCLDVCIRLEIGAIPVR